jgi:surface antigen
MKRPLTAFLIVATLASTAPPVFAQPSGSLPESCGRQERNGAIGGGLLGALAGAAVAGRHNQAGGAVIGGLIGAFAGSQVAKHLSACGRALAAQAALSAAETGEVQTVVAPDTQQRITVMPGSDVAANDGRTCKTITTTIDDGSSSGQSETSTLCKGPDGRWS